MHVYPPGLDQERACVPRDAGAGDSPSLLGWKKEEKVFVRESEHAWVSWMHMCIHAWGACSSMPYTSP